MISSRGVAIFFKISLRSGYHQVKVVKQDIPKTTFKISYGNYEFVVMPFGLTNTPTIFMDLMNSGFQDCLDKFLIVFINDIQVYFRIQEEHTQNLRFVL